MIMIIIMSFGIMGGVGIKVHIIGARVGEGLMLLPMGVGLWIAVRLKCPRCGFQLSRKLYGSALLNLWMEDRPCPQCGEKL